MSLNVKSDLTFQKQIQFPKFCIMFFFILSWKNRELSIDSQIFYGLQIKSRGTNYHSAETRLLYLC